MLRADGAGSVMAGILTAATILGAVQVMAQTVDGQAIGLELKVGGQIVALADDLNDALKTQADKILRSCGYDNGDQEQAVWRAALAEPSFIRLIYAVPIEQKLIRREILVYEAVFSPMDPDFLGSPLLHHAGRTTMVFKCFGGEMLKLMCMSEPASHFPPGYRNNCHVLRRE